MGTRGAFGFFHNGQTKVTYNHWDSYPKGLGKQFIAELLPFDTEQLAGAASRLTLVEEESTPTPDLIERYGATFGDANVGRQSMTDWYCLLRSAQGHVAPFITGQLDHMIDSALFLGYSLFCEWAYVFNTASNMVEVYTGFNVSTPEDADGRYASTGHEGNYYGVRLLTEIDFLTLRRAVGHATQAGVPLDTAIDIVADGAVGVIEAADKLVRPHIYAGQEG